MSKPLKAIFSLRMHCNTLKLLFRYCYILSRHVLGLIDHFKSAINILHYTANIDIIKNQVIAARKASSAVNTKVIKRKKQQTKRRSRNTKQIFILSFDALRERKARSALTILMVVVGGGLMIAINGMSAGQSAFVSRRLNFLAPNIMFISSGQHGFRGPSATFH